MRQFVRRGRRFSTAFDGDMARLYMNFFQQAGPVWQHTVSVVNDTYISRPPVESILDIASGPGEPGISLAKHLPKANVSITDGAGAMITLAKGRVKEFGLEDRVTCFQMGMDDFSKVEKNSVDLATAQFALMFSPDLPNSLKQIHDVLKPNSVLIGTVWENFYMLPILKDAMTVVLGEVPPPPPINPLSLADSSNFDDQLRNAGFVLEGRHNEQGNIEINLGKIEDDDTLKSVLIPVMPKLNELEASGRADVWEIAKNAALKAARMHGAVNNGNLVIPASTYRYFVAAKM